MNYLDIAHSFVERTARSTSAQHISADFTRTLEELGFRYFACSSHVDPLRPVRAVMVLNYPREFVEEFSVQAWHRIDPVFLRADRSPTPFSWDAPEFLRSLTSDQRAVLREARHFGLAHGYTIPIHAPGYAGVARASCSVVPESPRLPQGTYSVVHLIASYVFQAAWRELEHTQPLPDPPPLTPRERECLELVALGKDQWSIGRLLNISEHTVHAHIESARRRLGASHSAHAVAIALASGQIKFGDLHFPSEAPDAPAHRLPSQKSSPN